MKSKMTIRDHSIHKMLVAFPIGLLVTSAFFDVLHLFTKNPQWNLTAGYLVFAGLLGGFAAAPFGWLDWFAIPSGTRAKQVGLAHGLGNIVVLLLFGLSLGLRWASGEPTEMTLAYVLSFTGVGLIIVTASLGAELVDKLGISIDNDVLKEEEQEPPKRTGTELW